MSEQIVTKLESLNFKQIAISKSKVDDFIHNIKTKDHAILLFQNESIRDETVRTFLDKSKNQTYTACFVHDTSKYNCDQAITYDELIENQTLLTTKINEFLINVLDKTYPNDFPRIACEDTVSFSEAGFFEEHQKLGDKLDTRIIDDSTILCCYNTDKLDDDKINTVLQSRDYIILEEPFSVYQKQHS